MKVRVLLFAGLRERAGAAELEVDDLPASCSVETVISRISTRHPFVRSFPFTVARNAALVEREAALHDGDELALLPPVSGG